MELGNLLKADNTTPIIAIAAIISPVVVALISGIVSLISKHIECKHTQQMEFWKVYYKDCSNTFSSFLDSVGRLLADSQSDEKIFDVLSYLYQSYVYADEQLILVLNEFHFKLESWNNNSSSEELLNDCQAYCVTVAQDINRVLSKYASIKGKPPKRKNYSNK